LDSAHGGDAIAARRLRDPAVGREDRIIPSPRSAEILEEIVAEFQRPFTVIMYENAGHGLRDVESNDRIPYWDDLLPWLEGVIR
jgi:hypothetical protein